MGQYLILFLLAVLVVALIAVVITTMYVKAPPNVAYIISGMGKNPRILIGQGGVKLPFVERLDKLYVGQLSVDIKTGQSVPTNDFINVNVDAVAKIQVDVQRGIEEAMKNFLNMSPEDIASSLKDSLEGNMREIIGAQDLRSINTDRDKFSDQVAEKAQKDMEKLGIRIISCNIQNVTDDNGLIRDLGMDNTARIQKEAQIAKANAQRDVAIAQAEAEKSANDARVKADTEIAQRNTDLSIKKSELKKQSDIKQAEADAAYRIQEQEQQKTIQAAIVNAQIAKAEREAELKNREVTVRENELSAQIKKQAEAEKYAIEQKAQADLERRKREAEAKKYEMVQEAEAKKALAEAQKFAMEQEAEGIRAKGEAEATAIKAKGEAEAAAMDKKAEALAKYGKAAIIQMTVEALPKVAAEVARPLSDIDKVTIIDGGNGAGVGSYAGNVPAVMAKTFQAVKEATGVDLAEIVKAETYDAKVTRNVNITGIPEPSAEKDSVSDAVVSTVVKDSLEDSNS